MNECLKSIVDEAYDAKVIVQDALTKNYTALIGDAVKAVEDGVSLESKVADFKAECQSLIADPAADADLLAYVTAKAGGDQGKAAKVVPAVAKLALDLVQDVEAILAAVKG